MGSRFSPALLGFSFCCDDPDTPGIDEGYAAGWPLATRQALEDLRARTRKVNLIHMRSGPFRDENAASKRYSRLRGLIPTSIRSTTDTGSLRRAVDDANALGFAVEVDVIDGWGLRHGELVWPDGCSVTRTHPQARHLQWARDVAQATHHATVIYQIGNEISLCKPSVRWIRGIRDAIKEVRPDAVIGSDSFPEEVDYFTYHGSLDDIQASNQPTVHNESNNLRETADAYLNWLEALNAAGSYGSIWFGPTALVEREALLRRLN